eukprot:scaffold26296_cov15-Prasinocladus_malaysianus.AAC.1
MDTWMDRAIGYSICRSVGRLAGPLTSLSQILLARPRWLGHRTNTKANYAAAAGPISCCQT